jgi:hypothetical protein
VSLSEASRIEIHTFCDASIEAIAAVSYIKVVLQDGQAQVSFVFGKAKLAPPHATTIPRLELCAAVLGVEITELVMEELAVKPHSVTYYTDSKVTLGYILKPRLHDSHFGHGTLKFWHADPFFWARHS